MSVHKRIIDCLSSSKLTILCLLFFCVFIFWGTLYQVEYGIYAAQERFFNAWIIFIRGVFPVPGVRSLIALLSINLLTGGFRSFLFPFTKAGILLMHTGTAVLLIGSGFSAFLIDESSVSLAEGERTSTGVDFDTWEFLFSVNNRINHGAHNPKSLVRNFSELSAGSHIQHDGITVILEKWYDNCNAYGASFQKIDSLQSKPYTKNGGPKIPGLTLSVFRKEDSKRAHSDINLYGGSATPSSFVLDSDTIWLSLRPRQVQLPLSIELVTFYKENHPGTKHAKSFRSRIQASGDRINREVVISMNKPFKHKAFTFYQTGYSQNPENGRYMTTLSVVKNPVRFAPYLAGVIIMAGLLFHFILQFIYAYRCARKEA